MFILGMSTISILIPKLMFINTAMRLKWTRLAQCYSLEDYLDYPLFVVMTVYYNRSFLENKKIHTEM